MEHDWAWKGRFFRKNCKNFREEKKGSLCQKPDTQKKGQILIQVAIMTEREETG